MLGEHELRGAGLRARASRPTPRTRTRRCRSSTSTSRSEQLGAGRAARRDARPQERASASAASSTRSTTSSARCSRRSARTTRRSRRTQRRTSSISPTRRRSAASPRCASALKDWAARAHQLPEGAHRARRGRDRRARAEVYYKLGCIKREQGQAQAGDQQLREGARRRSGAPPDARSAGRRLHRPARTGSRSSPTSARSSTTSSTATSASRCSIEIGDIWSDKDKNPPKAIEALEEALDLKPREPRRSSTSCCSSTRRRRTGRG